MTRHLPNLGAMLDRLLGLLDEGASQVYRDLGVDFRPRFTPVLRHLAQQGPSSIRDLSAATCLTHSATSQTVAAMRARGLVGVRPGKLDARERHVHLTPKAERMRATLELAWADMDRASAALVDEAAPELTRALLVAIAALERQPFARRVEQVAATRSPGSRRRPAH
jgi:DNA-binding MarR family transcriptional regulator